MAEQLFIRLRGRIQGPFTAEQLQSMARRGQFSRTHEISEDGVNWTRAMSRTELFSAPREEPVLTMEPIKEESPSIESPPVASGPPRAEVWYYHQLGANHGPVDFSHLQYLIGIGQVAVDDLVWKEGLPEWLPAARVPGLTKQNPSGPVGGSGSAVYVGAVGPNYPPSHEYPSVSGMAVASLVLGILWIAGIGSILAIIFGSVALYQIQVSRGRLTGKGLAIAGLVLGIVFLSAQIIVAIHDAMEADRFG